MLKFQAGAMERRESKSNQIGRRMADFIYPVCWLMPTGLTYVTISRMFEDRPLIEKVGSIAVTGCSWVAGLVIRELIETQRAEDEAYYFDDDSLRK